MSSAALGGRPRVRPRCRRCPPPFPCRPPPVPPAASSVPLSIAARRTPRLRERARSGGTLPDSRAAAATPPTPCSTDTHGRSCQKLRTHYTIATLPPCTAAIFLVSARRLAQRAAANRTSFCPVSACRAPPTPHSTRTVPPSRPSAAAAPLSSSRSVRRSLSLPRGLRRRHGAYYRAPLPQWSATQATDIGYGVMEAAESSTDSSPNCASAILACLALSVVYVASLYVWSSPHNRYVAVTRPRWRTAQRRRRRRRRDHRTLSTSTGRSPPRSFLPSNVHPARLLARRRLAPPSRRDAHSAVR